MSSYEMTVGACRSVAGKMLRLNVETMHEGENIRDVRVVKM